MIRPAAAIRTATSAEMPQVVSVIVAAFVADPVARFAWPSVHDHLQHMPRATREFGGAAFAHDSAYVSAEFHGAALWLPPGVFPNGEALEQVIRETVPPDRIDDLLGTFGEMEQSHPEEPHWHLPMIGVEPHAQGRGLGAALLSHALARCDRDGALAYLESSNPRNVPLYLRHGFEILREIRVGAAPPVTPMLRRPRAR